MRRRAGEHRQYGRSGDQEIAGSSDPERRIDAEGNTGDQGNTHAWHLTQQKRSGWSFNVELRPYGESW
jgi:hypothetical protein